MSSTSPQTFREGDYDETGFQAQGEPPWDVICAGETGPTLIRSESFNEETELKVNRLVGLVRPYEHIEASSANLVPISEVCIACLSSGVHQHWCMVERRWNAYWRLEALNASVLIAVVRTA